MHTKLVHFCRMSMSGMLVVQNKNSSNWSLQNGYSNTYNNENYPYQSVVSGIPIDFSILLNTFKNNIAIQCSGIDQGFKIILSTPDDALQMSQNYFRLPLLHISAINIEPELTITTEKLRRFQPHQRQCFYGDERQLRFFKMYSQINCKVECLANFTKQECGCVRFSMPSIYTFYDAVNL